MPNVLADSSVVIEFFRPGGREDVREAVGLLLDRGNLATCGIIVSELLQGVRSEEREPLEAFLREARYIELARVDFDLAGETCNLLRKKGHKVPITDALIASVCIRSKIQLFTLDAHFNQFGELKLYKL
jgi:predicted nucleic acid-binding protein